MTKDELRNLIEQISEGSLDPGAALERLAQASGIDDLGFARLDTHREARTGIAEAIFAPGKTFDQLKALIDRSMKHHNRALVSRLEERWGELLAGEFPTLKYSPLARILYGPIDGEQRLPLVAVVTAGTSDQAVAEEAAIVLEHLGHTVDRVWDVGVAGIHRLFSVLDRLRGASALIVVAGMEGALPSVVAGLVDRPVVGVPTSVGYGASFGGIAALLGMLNSCSGGVGVVNIDNGFGAAILAHRMTGPCSEQKKKK